eukprot:354133-Chlamydomonas_euryale.AAC.3
MRRVLRARAEGRVQSGLNVVFCVIDIKGHAKGRAARGAPNQRHDGAIYYGTAHGLTGHSKQRAPSRAQFTTTQPMAGVGAAATDAAPWTRQPLEQLCGILEQCGIHCPLKQLCGIQRTDGVAVVNADGVAVVNADGVAVVNADGVAVVNADGVAVVIADGVAVVNADGVAVVNADGVAVVNAGCTTTSSEHPLLRGMLASCTAAAEQAAGARARAGLQGLGLGLRCRG